MQSLSLCIRVHGTINVSWLLMRRAVFEAVVLAADA